MSPSAVDSGSRSFVVGVLAGATAAASLYSLFHSDFGRRLGFWVFGGSEGIKRRRELAVSQRAGRGTRLEPLWGGCLCGQLSWRAEGGALQVFTCHCTMCRRVCGGTISTFFSTPRSQLSFFNSLTGASTSPKVWRSSDQASRGFCGTCGASILMDYDEEKHTVWVLVGTLDKKLVKVLPPIEAEIYSGERNDPWARQMPAAEQCRDLEAWVRDSASLLAAG